MSWLVLFDVDGTLLLGHDPVYVTANRAALEEVYGTFADVADVPASYRSSRSCPLQSTRSRGIMRRDD